MSEPRVAVAATKFARGFAPGRQDPGANYEVLPVRHAIDRVYSTDAHLVTYVVEGAQHQPRINKPGLASFEGKVVVEVLFCDVDNPGHVAWTDATYAAAREQDLAVDVLANAGVYYTDHGRRIVQPLVTPIAVEEVEPYLRAWLTTLEVAGVTVDRACSDWTRHFRLAHVRRNGRVTRSRCVDLARMAPIELPAIEPTLLDAVEPITPATRSRAARPLVPLVWSAAVPERWASLVEPIAAAVRAEAADWHALFLALAGALLMRAVAEEHVPALCRAISVATGADTRTDDRERAAQSTVERRRARQRYAASHALAEKWPGVARVLDALFEPAPPSTPSVPVAAAPPLAETTRALEDVFRKPQDGLTLVAAACGVGKTMAAVTVAAERAKKPYASPDAAGLRAPPQSKTSLGVDKHLLAKQIIDNLATRGIAARRHFGPLSMVHENGAHECRFHKVAKPLVEGGQHMQWILCKGRGVRPCEHFDTCAAKDGFEGPADSRVAVGPHALVGALDGAAGTTGLLVIDEPPSIIETIVLTAFQLDAAREARFAFESPYVAALLPALDALRRWVECGEEDLLTTLPEAVRCFEVDIAPDVLVGARRWTGVDGDAVACGRAAPVPEEGPNAPPLRFEQIEIARKSVVHAKKIGAASRVFAVIHQALMSDLQVAARIETRSGGRAIVVMRARETLVRALRREGSVIVTDANAQLHAPIYAQVVGYDRPVRRFEADDGAPIERTMIHLKSATRTRWQPYGKLTIAPNLKRALTLAIEWAREDGAARQLALITLPLVRLAIEAALRPDDAAIDARWAEEGQDASVLATARAELGPIVRKWPGTILFGHYGALRGLDTMAGVDALVTLGDPWANMGDAKAECAFLRLDDWEARYTAMCAAELEQAHGRLRTVHRTRPGRALHVGAIRPSGRGWARDDVRVGAARRKVGRVSDVTVEDVIAAIAVAGGVKALARKVGCSPQSVRAWRDGKAAVPERLLGALA